MILVTYRAVAPVEGGEAEVSVAEVVGSYNNGYITNTYCEIV